MKRLYSILLLTFSVIPVFAQLQPPTQVDTLIVDRVSYMGEEVKPAHWPASAIYRNADKVIVSNQTYLLKELLHSYGSDHCEYDKVESADDYKEYKTQCNGKECRVTIVKRYARYGYTPVIKYVVDDYSFFVHPTEQKQQESIGVTEEDVANMCNVVTSVEAAPTARVKGRTTVGVLPRPSLPVQKEGTVVVDIWVNQNGSVIRAVPGAAGTTTTDKDLWNAARQAALKAKFNTDWEAKEQQQGTITYVFKLTGSKVDAVEEAIPFHLVEKQPSFKGSGPNEFTKWVNQRLVYPKKCKENGIQGRVTLQFTVTKEGYVTNVKVLRGVDPLLDKEVIRVVSSSPKWTPGTTRGKAVNVTYTFPVIFQNR